MLTAVKIVNVHERRLAASTEAVGTLIDGLASAGDRLWPTARWPAMKFDRPLQVGAIGGHGFVRYAVQSYDPGRRIVFVFRPERSMMRGFTGVHSLQVESGGGGATILRHEIRAEASVAMALRWIVIVRPLHDALIEDAFDCTEMAATGRVAAPAQWSPWVRAMRAVLHGLGWQPNKGKDTT